MKYRAHNAKRDANEGEIVKALRDIGCDVHSLDQPLDLLVGYRGRNYLIEVKMPKGKLTEGQQEFSETWRGQFAVVRSPEQAIQVVTGQYAEHARIIFNN